MDEMNTLATMDNSIELAPTAEAKTFTGGQVAGIAIASAAAASAATAGVFLFLNHNFFPGMMSWQCTGSQKSY